MGASIGGSASSQSGSSSSSGVQANQYNAGQMALQNQLSGTLSNYLSTGNTPSGFTNNPAAVQNLNNQLNNQTNPAIAAQFGAGSPQIGAQDALAQTNLAAQNYQFGVSAYQQALGGASNMAYTPIGQTQSQSGQSSASGSSVSGSGYGTSLLSLLLGH